MHLFYAPKIENDRVVLDADESRHLAKVLRLQEGEAVSLIDGHGYSYEGEVSIAHPKKSEISIQSKRKSHTPFGIHLAAAPTKNLNRWEWFLEKATEIGIDRISPIITTHSERKVLKRDRQERILLSAMKQSYKSKMPDIDDLQKFKDFIAQDFTGEKFIAHCEEDGKRIGITEVHQKGKAALILIGPEGDFSPEEIQLATEAGFVPVSLGASRLRTETAALIALHSIHLLNE